MVSKVYVPDETAVDALRNAPCVHSKVWDDLYVNTPIILQDALRFVKNFITVEKDKQAFLNQHNAMKQAASMATKTPQEPCQNSSYNKANKKKNIFYVVDEDEYPTSATIVQEKRWKV